MEPRESSDTEIEQRNILNNGIPRKIQEEYNEKIKNLKEKNDKGIELVDEDKAILDMSLENYYDYYYDSEYDVSFETPNIANEYIPDIFGVSKQMSDLFKLKKNQIIMMDTRGYDISDEQGILDSTPTEFGELLENLKNGTYDSFWRRMTSIHSYERTSFISFKDKNAKEMMSQHVSFLSNIYKKKGSKDPTDYTCVVIYVNRDGDKRKRITKTIAEPIYNFILGSNYEDIIIVSNKQFTSKSIRLFSNIPAVLKPKPGPGSTTIPGKVVRGLWFFSHKELMVNPLDHTLTPRHSLMSKPERMEFKRIHRHPLFISDEDPVVKFYGWPVGGMVKITRDISTIGGAIDKMVSRRLIKRDNLINLSERKFELIY